jgi:hypothetical protein
MKQMFVIYDSKAEIYGDPVTFENDKVAIRSLKRVVNDPQGGALHEHPEDFHLFRIAAYDPAMGSIAVTQTHEQIVNLIHLKDEPALQFDPSLSWSNDPRGITNGTAPEASGRVADPEVE